MSTLSQHPLLSHSAHAGATMKDRNPISAGKDLKLVQERLPSTAILLSGTRNSTFLAPHSTTRSQTCGDLTLTSVFCYSTPFCSPCLLCARSCCYDKTNDLCAQYSTAGYIFIFWLVRLCLWSCPIHQTADNVQITLQYSLQLHRFHLQLQLFWGLGGFIYVTSIGIVLLVGAIFLFDSCTQKTAVNHSNRHPLGDNRSFAVQQKIYIFCFTVDNDKRWCMRIVLRIGFRQLFFLPHMFWFSSVVSIICTNRANK